MTETMPSLMKPLTDPAQLPAAGRAYYRATWGFDPVGDRQSLGKDKFRYEACFPLEQDPPLSSSGVTICARVDWHDGAIHNRIVFRRGGEDPQEAAVECTHTVVYAGPAGDAFNFAADAYTARDRLDPAAREMVDRAGGPVALPPWEHFAALKSYVAAVAEVGISVLIRATIPHSENKGALDTFEIPFGFNSTMQKQVFSALLGVAPDATSALQEDLTRELLDVAPPKWIVERWEILERIYYFGKLFKKDSTLFLTQPAGYMG